MYAKAAIVSLFAGLAAAQRTPPVGEPKGNPISRPLNEVVPKCEPFTITWEPTTPNTVSVLLLKGPSTNVVKFGPSLAEGIANSGKLSWTPASDLPTTDGNTGYGLQIVDDVTGQYQYSTQFGISAGKCSDNNKPSPSSAPGAPAASPEAPAGGYPVASHTPVPVSSTLMSQAPYPTSTVAVNVPGIPCPPNSTVVGVKPTGAPVGNNTIPPPPEVTTNAAAGLTAGLTFAGAAAIIAAFML